MAIYNAKPVVEIRFRHKFEATNEMSPENDSKYRYGRQLVMEN